MFVVVVVSIILIMNILLLLLVLIFFILTFIVISTTVVFILMTSFRGNHCGHQQKVFKWFRGDLLVVGESAFFKDFTRLAVVSALLQCLLK